MMKVNHFLFLCGVVAILQALLACGRGGARSLPADGFNVEFVEHKIPTEMVADQVIHADVTIKNITKRTWPSTPNSEGRNAVNLSYHWLDKKGRAVVFEGLRTPLPRDLNPGESAQLEAAIQAPSRAGKYKLEVTLVQEFVAWFPERDGEKLALSVIVNEAKAGASVSDRAPPTAAPESDVTRTKEASRLAEANESVAAKQFTDKTPAGRHPSKPASLQAKQSIKNESPRIDTWSVQIGSYVGAKEAQALAKKLQDKGYEAYVVVAEVKGKKWHRVRVGHLAGRKEAEKLQKTLVHAEGFKQALITN
jgi:cell division septation protein DedD